MTNSYMQVGRLAIINYKAAELIAKVNPWKEINLEKKIYDTTYTFA